MPPTKSATDLGRENQDRSGWKPGERPVSGAATPSR